MTETRPLTILCLASFEKGTEFIRECKRQGCRVLLVTSENNANANWPRESIDDVFLMPNVANKWNQDDVIYGVSYLARMEVIDRIVALDDADVETAAALREHLRIPGMGDTTSRHFRDKLAMRVQAKDHGILVPEFIHVLNHDALHNYAEHVSPPWLLKPRFGASLGGVKIPNSDELWPALEKLGDKQSFHVLEHYIPGEIYHVNSIVWEREVVYGAAYQYGKPPMEVTHNGGIFTSHSLEHGSLEERALLALNREVLKSLGFVRGVSHTEFIKGQNDGRFYFLESSGRVNDENIVKLVEASSGINLWAEWAKIEIGPGKRPYHLPEHRCEHSGMIVLQTKQERPNLAAYQAPEIFWRLENEFHAGLVIHSSNLARIKELLDHFSEGFYRDFLSTEQRTETPAG